MMLCSYFKNIFTLLLAYLGLVCASSSAYAQFTPPRILKHPGQIRTERLNTLNSTYRETNLNITPDGKYLFFMSGRGQQPWSNPFHTIYKGKPEYDGDIWYAQKVNGKWQYPRCLDGTVNTSNGEDEPNISPDGQTVYFQSWGRAWEKEGGPYYRSTLKGVNWGTPQGLGGGINAFFLSTQKPHAITRPDGSKRIYMGTPYATDGATVSADGKTFIVAAGADYDGNMDLYISRKDANGQWSFLRRLSVSTIGDERSPFLAADGKTLYFASNGYAGWGGLDIFKTVIQEDGSHDEIVNVGAPFNTWLDDYGFILTASGDEGYFVREGDIYYADIKNASPELKPSNSTLMIAGKVTSSKSQRGTQAKIQIKDPKTGKTIAEGQSNSLTGEYAVVIPIEYPEFVQEVSKTGFQSHQQNFKTQIETGLNEINADVVLNPIQNEVIASNQNQKEQDNDPAPKPKEAAADYGQENYDLKEQK